MITITASEFTGAPAGSIGISQRGDTITIFERGDESTPEWLALHPEPDPIAEAKAAKRAEINADRDAAVNAPVEALGHTWDSTYVSQFRINSAIALALNGLPLPSVWRDYHNVDMPVTDVAELLAIGAAMAVATETAMHVSWARKAALSAAETLEEIAAI